MMKLAINGFGRIGRASLKIASAKPDIDVLAINDLADPEMLAYLFKYDSAYGHFNGSVEAVKEGDLNFLVVNGKKINLFSQSDPTKLPWKDLDIDVVLECTGFFEKDDSALAHITGGAKKVVVSAPTKGGTAQIFLLGVNHETYNNQPLISNASCTTNCISPVVQVLNTTFGIKKSLMTTIHAVTANQNIVDGTIKGKDFRRGRAGMSNMVPTSTGAAIATTQVIPSLANKFDGISIRVPVITGSLSDITMVMERNVTVEEINSALIEASKTPKYKGIIKATSDEIVSSDIVGSSFSAIVDLSMTRVVDGDLVKVLAWYDNEWGYSNRLVEMAQHVHTNS